MSPRIRNGKRMENGKLQPLMSLIKLTRVRVSYGYKIMGTALLRYCFKYPRENCMQRIKRL